MTLDETRDEIAEALGYEYGTWGWQKQAGDKFQVALRHPVPATLDGVASMMPPHWYLRIRHTTRGWNVEARHRDNRWVSSNRKGDDELAARTRILLAVLRHEKGAK